jgi:tRNA pseudouridine38-40 synthase
MANYKSIVAYDGTEFQGFQRQAAGLRTVQGVLELALREVGWQGSSLKAAGRTDAGVHARGQVIAYELTWRHDPEQLTQALNANLPSDVAVSETEVARDDFHPRFSAQSRRYSYRVLLQPIRDPLRERYAWRIWPEPELERLAAAAVCLIGSHDFVAFGRAPIPGGHTVRQVSQAEWRKEVEKLTFEIEANAFLYNMVRRLVAGMLEVGAGKVDLGDFIALLDNPDQRWEGRIAAPQGLCLEAVNYQEEPPS